MLLVGGYLFRNEADTIKRFVAAIGQRPCRSVLMMAGDFNTNLEALEESNLR